MTSQQQLYGAGLLRDNRPPIYIAGPFPTRAEADAWVRNANGAAVVLPWPQDRLSEDPDMAKTEPRPATYEDVLNAPEHLVAEILHGRLVTHPRPAPKHARAASRLGGILTPPFDEGIDGPGGWVIIDEPELHFGSYEPPEVASPELAGWRIERMPEPPETAYFTTVPDWICEMISPSSIKIDRIVKRGIYAQFGVPYYWIGDPLERILETFVLKNGVLELAETFRDNDTVAAPPFAEAPFALGRLWWGK